MTRAFASFQRAYDAAEPPDEDPVDFEDLPWKRRRMFLGDWEARQEARSTHLRRYYATFCDDELDDIIF